MTYPIFNISDVSVILIQSTVAATYKILELINPRNLLSSLINYIQSNSEGEPKPSDVSPYLESLYERLLRAQKYLEELLHDHSVIGRANLKALYEYIIGLFEQLRKMCPD